MEVKAVTEQGRKALEAYQDNLPADLDVATTLLEQFAAADPKQVLVQYMTDMTKSGETATTSDASILDAVTALLYAQGKGYDADLVGKCSSTVACGREFLVPAVLTGC